MSKPKVGILSLSLEFYETLAPELREDRERWVREQILPALDPVCEPVFSGAAFSVESIDRTVREYEVAGVDLLLVICLTYSPSQLALATLRKCRLPILIWNTQECFAVDGKFDVDAMIANHGVHGTQDLANVLLRSGIKFDYLTSHLNDPGAIDQLADRFIAAAAVTQLGKIRLGLLGSPFPGMGDMGLDHTRFIELFGGSWQTLSIDQYHTRAAEADQAEVDTLVAEYHASYAVANDVTQTDLDQTARSELSLRSMVVEQKMDAFSYQFLTFGEDSRTVTLPFVAASRLMADGYGFGGEGDLIGATGHWLLAQLQSPASFAEIFTTDFAGNGLFMSHMGEANVAMARRDRPVSLVARPEPIVATTGRQLALVTCLEPGPVTLAALTVGPNGRWRWICSSMEVCDWGPLETMCVPHFKISPRAGVDVRGWLTDYATAGGPHHLALSAGDARHRIELTCRLLDIDYVEI
jgi:L-arabinose isomerase